MNIDKTRAADGPGQTAKSSGPQGPGQTAKSSGPQGPGQTAKNSGTQGDGTVADITKLKRNEKTKQLNLEELMREYGNDVLRTAYSYVKDKSTAEDLFQETFIKVYHNLDRFRGESSVKTWIIRITINVCKDFLKSAYQQHVVPMTEFDEDIAVSDTDFEEVENADRNAMIKDAVMELPDNYREAVMCVYYKNMSLTEASEVLGVPEGTVKSRLARAREKLKNKLERRL